MRKRDALRMALHLPEFPKLKEWEKLLYAGVAILVSMTALGLGLVIRTGNIFWGLLAAAGFFIYTWFAEASIILREEERSREMIRRRMKLRKLIRKEVEKA